MAAMNVPKSDTGILSIVLLVGNKSKSLVILDDFPAGP
jgi:hypothetical protein